MKKILFTGIVLLVMFSMLSCHDKLDTEPTNRVAGSVILSNDENAMIALDGIYRLMYSSGWASDNNHQYFGHTSVILHTSLMGEDLLMSDMGAGFFWYEYIYDIRSLYTSKLMRSYATWNYYYTLISNANYIIAAENELSGNTNRINYIIGNAYAIRAHSYFMLIQIFQHTYMDYKDAPGVPLYTEPTTPASEGKGRGTVEDVYAQITADLDKAIGLLKDAKQEHKSHIDYYVANAISAQVALVMNDWDKAASCAEVAMQKPGATFLSDFEFGMNSINNSSVMWGMEIIKDQSTIFASFFSHMDAKSDGFYAYGANKCINSWLYDQIPATDKRKAWFQGANGETEYEKEIKDTPYNQVKFKWADVTAGTGDYIFMRYEEPLLIRAEALCRKGDYSGAKALMEDLGKKRDDNYEVYLQNLSNSSEMSFVSTGTITTLMDYILVQRRIELWGEVSRLFDLMRLRKNGWTRRFTNTNHSKDGLLEKYGEASLGFPYDYKEMILTIPQTEFNGNPNLNPSDQNPM